MTEGESPGRAVDEHLTSLPVSRPRCDIGCAGPCRAGRGCQRRGSDHRERQRADRDGVQVRLGCPWCRLRFEPIRRRPGAADPPSARPLDPATQGHRPRQRLGSSLATAVAQAMGEIRNTDGTGHGRARRSDLHVADALLARDAAEAWCSWTLATASRIFGTRAGLDQAIVDIGGDRVFSQGNLAAYLDALGLQDLHEADQRKIGLAVARRWTVNGTVHAAPRRG